MQKKNSTFYSMRPTSILKKKEKRKKKKKEKEEGSMTDPRCCGAELTHDWPESSWPPTLRLATPPIPVG
jgi:hypothetical protein